MGSIGSQAALGLSAAAIWGTADFSGGLAAKRAPSSLVVVLAHGFSLLLLLIAAFVLHTSWSGYGLYSLLSGVFCGTGLIALYSALSRDSMGLPAAVSGVLTAVVPVVFSQFREGRAPLRQLLGFAMAALSIWLVAYAPGAEKHSTEGRRRQALGLAVLAGLSFGVMLILMDLAATGGVLRAVTGMRITSTLVAGLAAVVALWGRRQGASFACEGRGGRVLLLIVLAGVLDTTGNLLYLQATLAGRLDVAAILSSLYPLGTMLLAWRLLKERVSRMQATGMALALAAILVVSI